MSPQGCSDVTSQATSGASREQISSGSNCQTYSSSTVISYSDIGGSNTPKVYQETSQTRTAPGGIRETRRTMRDSNSGMEQMSIGHHIRERAHVMQRSRNHRTGDREESQEYINMNESCWLLTMSGKRETSRYRGHRGVLHIEGEAPRRNGSPSRGPGMDYHRQAVPPLRLVI
ncbi:hypothetical protein FKM82_017400, partial [Ascaphus truei]